MVRIAIYARVSTSGQTVANQVRELTLWAERAGHAIVRVYEDNGISGTKGRDKRPGLDQALKDATRRRYDMLAAWSVDRLGRSLQDVVSAMQELRGAGVDLFLHQQALDTSGPTQTLGAVAGRRWRRPQPGAASAGPIGSPSAAPDADPPGP